MSAQGEGEQTVADCPFCTRRGLPILPLRYAVARNDFSGSHDPQVFQLRAPFGEGVEEVVLPDEQHYTLRLVREGFLYVYNQLRGVWTGYTVTRKGYLRQYVSKTHDELLAINLNEVGEIDGDLQPPTEDVEFTCRREPDHPHLARCVMIPDADAADRIYFAFSDTAWTKRVWHEHATNAEVSEDGLRRRDQMRVLSLAEWRHRTDAEAASALAHTDDLAKLGERVAETKYPWAIPKLPSVENGMIVIPEVLVFPHTALWHSPQSVGGMKQQVPELVEWAQAQAEPLGMRPAMVALEDPVGIAADLAGLMGARLSDFLEQDELQRPLAISALVDSLQEAIRNQAELDKIKQSEDLEVRLMHMPPIPPHGLGHGPAWGQYRQQRERYDRLRNDAAYREAEEARARQRAVDRLIADDLDAEANSAWRKYQRKLQEGEPERWKEDVYQPLLDDYDQKYMVPLAQVHQAWLHGEAMMKSFACNHDDSDIESGAGYVQALLLCLQDTQQNQVCFDNYQAWLEANTSDPGNLLQRALAYNQKEVLDALDAAVSGEGLPVSQLPDVPWEALIDLFEKSIKHLNQGGQNTVAQLIAAVGGPIIEVLDTMIDQTAGRLVVALGVMGKAPVTVVQHTGTVNQALDITVDMMQQLNPEVLGDVDADLLKRQLEIRSRGKRQTLQTRGADGRFGASHVTIRVDRFAVGQVKGSLTPEQTANRAAGAVLSMDEWPRNGLARFRRMFGTNARLAVIGLIFEVVGANKMAKELDESMAHQRTENTWRFRSSMTAIIAGVGNLIHDGIVSGAKTGSVRLGKMANRAWVEWTGRLSRALGLVAAGVMAVWDGINVVREARKGNYGMAGLYFLSASAGFGAALLLGGVFGATITVFGAALSATGIGLVLVALCIAIALLIDFFRSNELQDWMERCLFGGLKEGRYENLDEEMEQFGLAMKALGVEMQDGEESGETTPALAPGAG